VNNTIGIFLHEEGNIKISNNKWTLLVYKDLLPIKEAMKKNDLILSNLLDNFINKVDVQRMSIFKAEVQTHISLLNQISDSVNLKYKEIISDTKNYAYREKRGLVNGIGSIWKAITGNLDASDGEYFNDCIEKISRDETQIEALMKNQISVTTSVINSFNTTLQKLQIDEETYNKNAKQITAAIKNIYNTTAFYEAKLEILDLCESLMESYVFIENSLNDILNAITFARLKILHSSIITPQDLIVSLKQISQALHKNNLPLPVYISKLAQYLDIIELEAYQTDTKVVFILKIPLVEPETYIMYHIFPIPISDNRTGFHHIISTTQKYVARDDDSMLYISFQNMDNCKSLGRNQKICLGMLPHPIDRDSICEAQLLKQNIQTLPRTCQVNLVLATGYNVQEIDQNLWLILVTEPLPITTKCDGREPSSTAINVNSLLKLQPTCSAFIGSTRVQAKAIVEAYMNVTYRSHPVLIPYKCCDHLPTKEAIPNIQPLKLSKINTDDLNIAQHKLDQYSEKLDQIMNEPFVNRHISWFTIVTIIFIVILIALYIACKCRRRRLPMLTMGPTSGDDFPPMSRPPNRRSKGFQLSSILPRRRPSIHPEGSLEEDIELNSSS